MVPAGRWQAVKDTLSRPNDRSLTTSDAFGNSTTSTIYSLRLTIDTATSYVNITLSIQQSINYTTTILCDYDTLDTAISMLWLSLQLPTYWIQQPSLLLFHHWYSKSYDTLDTKLNPLSYYHWYSNPMIWHLWSNNQLYYYMWLHTTIFMLWNLVQISTIWYLIQQPSILLYNNRFSKLPYDLTILLIQN